MGTHAVHADSLKIGDGLRKPDGAGDVGGPRLKLVG